MTLEDSALRPDFILTDTKGNMVILEHFGLDEAKYNARRKEKVTKYNQFCDNNEECYFIETDENDMFNLKEKLGKKLNSSI